MSAPNLKEIEWAISELEQAESSFSAYSRLADLYTVRRELSGMDRPTRAPESRAFDAPSANMAYAPGNSDFFKAINGKNPADIWPIMNELMEALQVVNVRVHDNVLKKLKQL